MNDDTQKTEYEHFQSALKRILSAPKKLGKKRQTKPKTRKPEKKS